MAHFDEVTNSAAWSPSCLVSRGNEDMHPAGPCAQTMSWPIKIAMRDIAGSIAAINPLLKQQVTLHSYSEIVLQRSSRMNVR